MVADTKPPRWHCNHVAVCVNVLVADTKPPRWHCDHVAVCVEVLKDDGRGYEASALALRPLSVLGTPIRVDAESFERSAQTRSARTAS
jgi:hypothetical protein